MPITFPRRSPSDPTSPASFSAARLITPLAACAMLFAAHCGGGSSDDNPPPPVVVIDAESQLVDVGQRYVLDGSQSTDPNGSAEDLEFLWRIIDGAIDQTAFDDHCRENFDEICDENDNDYCSNDMERFCHEDSDCEGLGQCQENTGTTSSDCTSGICGLGEGDQGDVATFVAEVAGPFTVRLTAIGAESNGTRTMVLDTYPSLFVTDSILEFGGTEGGFLGAVTDAPTYAPDASQGTAHPTTGNLLVIDNALHLIREFDLRSGAILGTFGETYRFVDVPTSITFNPEDGNLFVAEVTGKVLMFNGDSGLLIAQFGLVGPGPVSIKFSPVNGELLVAYNASGAGIRRFNADGTDLGVLGETATAAEEAVDFDFLGESEDHDLLIADRSGKVVRCDSNGTNCGNFSASANSLLADGSPSAIAVNPSAEYTGADVMIADPVGERVITCNSNGNNCETFGETGDNYGSNYSDVFFAPHETPTTTTSTTTSTTLLE